VDVVVATAARTDIEAVDPEEADTVTAVVVEVEAVDMVGDVEDLEEAGVCMMTVVEMVVMIGTKSFQCFPTWPIQSLLF
jgi:hypothetical protein